MVFRLNNLQSAGNKAFVVVSGGYCPLGNSCHLVQSGACQRDAHACMHTLVDRFYFTSKLYLFLWVVCHFVFMSRDKKKKRQTSCDGSRSLRSKQKQGKVISEPE